MTENTTLPNVATEVFDISEALNELSKTLKGNQQQADDAFEAYNHFDFSVSYQAETKLFEDSNNEVDESLFELLDTKPVTAPFRVIVDTREQTPWHFTGIKDDKTHQPIVVPLITDQSLPQGDYAIEGLENWVSVERKSLRDFYRSISAERERFEREVARLNELCHVSAVIIEADWNEILSPESFCRVNKKTATRTMDYWRIDYPKVHWITSINRRHAEIQAFRFLEAGWKRWQHRKEIEVKGKAS